MTLQERQQKWKSSLEDCLTCKVDVAGALEWPRLRPLASARPPWHYLFFFFLFTLCFSFSSLVGETKYMIGLLFLNWFCQWGSTSVLVNNLSLIIKHGLTLSGSPSQYAFFSCHNTLLQFAWKKIIYTRWYE